MERVIRRGRSEADPRPVSVRILLAVYTLLNAGVFVFDAIRYGFGSFDWISFGVIALIIGLLWRGSRGAWLLSFLGSALGFIVFLANATDTNALAGSLAATAFFGAQVVILLTPQVRGFMRETAHRRAIQNHRRW
jgi:hypothetical protein